jgi:hypothetical protein
MFEEIIISTVINSAVIGLNSAVIGQRVSYDRVHVINA